MNNELLYIVLQGVNFFMEEMSNEEEIEIGSMKERRLIIEKDNKKTKFTFENIQYKNPEKWDVKNKAFFDSEVLVRETEYEPEIIKHKTDINDDEEIAEKPNVIITTDG